MGLPALLLLTSWCLVALSVVWLFLPVPWVGLQCLMVLYPDHTLLLFFLFKDDQVTKNLSYKLESLSMAMAIFFQFRAQEG